MVLEAAVESIVVMSNNTIALISQGVSFIAAAPSKFLGSIRTEPASPDEPVIPDTERTPLIRNEQVRQSYFKHLDFASQTYHQHFKDAMRYSWTSCKCSFYFFVHAIWPDAFQHTGSDIIVELNDEILDKYKNIVK